MIMMNELLMGSLTPLSFRPKGEIFKIPQSLRSFGMTWWRAFGGSE